MTTALLLATLTCGVVLGQAQAPLRVSMISLGIADSARSIKFYGETLGLPMIGKPGEVTLFKAGDVTLVLNQPAGAGKTKLAGSIEIIFPVNSVAASHKDLAERGCQFVAAPHEITPGMWAATFTDPDGHLLTILGPK
jgi:predicted enzyme related to lactoylglutathione lyase